MSDRRTPYGFYWGPMEVERVAEYRGRRVISIRTAHRHCEIHVSPEGRSIRVWIDGKEAGL